jgi:hypothetical protein
VGEVVTYEGLNYTALQSHFAYVGTNWNPARTPSLWKIGGTCGPVVSPTPTPQPPAGQCLVWAEGRAYTIGEVVSYKGSNYTALQAHFAYIGTGWNPADTPSLWKIGGVCKASSPVVLRDQP